MAGHQTEILQHKKKPAIIQVDASQEGLGAILTLDYGPVTHLHIQSAHTAVYKQWELLECVFGA